MASVIAVSGGFLAITFKHYLGWDVPWVVWTLVLTAASVVMMVRGVAVSTRLAGLFFGFEMLVLVVVSVAAIISHHAHLSLAPFQPSHITGGFSGLAAGFPLAIYLFVGWENSAALAEDTDNPRRNVGRAVFSSVAIMSVSYILFAYATVTGFGYNVDKLSASQIPFIDVAQGTLGLFAFFAYLAGLTSTLRCLIAGTNSQARLVFNAGREGLLPSFMGRVHPERRTPTNEILTFISISLLIIGGWGGGPIDGGHADSMDPVSFFVEASTMGTILVLLVYLASNIALPFYYKKFRPAEFSSIKHVLLPGLGAAAIVIPLFYLAKPGQPAPYSWFPYAAVVILVASILYALYLTRRDPSLGERVGSIVAAAEWGRGGQMGWVPVGRRYPPAGSPWPCVSWARCSGRSAPTWPRSRMLCWPRPGPGPRWWSFPSWSPPATRSSPPRRRGLWQNVPTGRAWVPSRRWPPSMIWSSSEVSPSSQRTTGCTTVPS